VHDCIQKCGNIESKCVDRCAKLAPNCDVTYCVLGSPPEDTNEP
jgi:hypothetical protein